ncbi:MAG TPA: hypothetical protein VM578_08670 [Candidatus Saccharimonadales bacterium]|nr:hypothetical protein [Candidatus Saccharimonadales bacterium]
MSKDTNGPSATHERPSSFVSLLSGWVQQGIESFFATQRILVDLGMRQNTNALKSIRQGISASEADAKDTPMKIIKELAVEGTANYIEAQRILLDLAQQENEIVLNGVTDRVSDYGTAVKMTNIVRRSIGTFIEMQQNFLVLASKRTQGLLQNSEDGKRKDENGLIGLANEAMDQFIAAQKEFLDVISEETIEEGGKKDHPTKKVNRAEMAKLAREAADSFIEAQKKLLDLAGQQVNVNMQAATRALDLKTPIRFMPVADIAGESVKSFVDAEKALVDSMMKTRVHVTEEPAKPKSHAAKAPVRRVKAKAKARAAKA